jgi:DNA-binding CsgD family transcriptional regulator
LLDRAASAPLLLVLEDLHWADTSTLDLVVFLAHNLGDRKVLLLATFRAEERTSAERVRRLVDGVRRSGSALVLDLGPLEPEELRALLAGRAGTRLPAALTDAIVARSEGNPFFAEELLAAAGDHGGELPRGLRDLLLQRVAGLDPATWGVLRLAAAPGRDVGYPLLRAVAALPDPELRESLRRAVEHGVLVAEQAKGGFRFRHALLAEAVYATVLPGEREELHARLAEELARSGAAAPGELAPHWAAAGRTKEALVASVEAAREAEEVFGLSEAYAHLERALRLWAAVPDASEAVGRSFDEVCAWTAELASQTGGAPRAVELARQAIELVGDGDPLRTALLHERLGAYLFESGSGDTSLAATERAVELVPARPPSPERARVLAALATQLILFWRHDESLAVCQEGLEVARTVGAREAELRALTELGSNLAYLGRGDEGLARLHDALALAEETGHQIPLQRAYVSLTDVLTMLGRPAEAASVGEEGLRAIRPYGADDTVLAANWVEAMLAIGEWDQADHASAKALRAITANYPHMPLILRADLEIGRGQFDAARAHLEAARSTVRHEPGLATYDGYVAELALWECRWVDADEAVRDGMTWARPRWGAQIRVWLCAKGLRAQAELAAVARARRDAGAVRRRLDRGRGLLAAARHAAQEASAITPNAEGWRSLAEAEYERARGVAAPGLWSAAAATWDRLERPPVAAYCRWRQAEALVAAGASRAEASAPLREAHAVAARIGAAPLLQELQALAQRARLEFALPETQLPKGRENLDELLGLTPREAEVLALVARGYTNREIAAELVSVRTAGVHVAHILRKLGAPNRLEAAAVAHRLSASRVTKA